jgi:uncharacterized phiE125 gp8 family phage protein
LSDAFLLCACGCGGVLHPVTPRTLHPPQRTAQPTVEPVTLDEAKLHLRVEHTVDDALIQSLISAARQHVEDVCEASFATDQTWQQTVDGSPGAWWIPLARGPVQSLTSVELVDSVGAVVDVLDCILDVDTTPARLYSPVAGWPEPPTTAAPFVRTRVRYVAGLPSPPPPVRHAMLLLIGEWYDARAAINIGNIVSPLPYAVEALLAPYRTTTGLVGIV